MIHRIINRLVRISKPDDIPQDIVHKRKISQREMVKQLLLIPDWEKKIEYYNHYEYSRSQGAWVNKSNDQHILSDNNEVMGQSTDELIKVNYGCGGNLIEGWVNIDLYESDASNYRYVNLLEKHPFPDNSIRFGFSEDMLEHLNQAESIFFISEIYRTLAPQGVMRLSFPGLEGVLDRHYSPVSEERVRQGEFEAYSFWDHIHFYSREELALVARHIGFSNIQFVEYGNSQYAELCQLDTRSSQIDLNTYVELTK